MVGGRQKSGGLIWVGAYVGGAGAGSTDYQPD